MDMPPETNAASVNPAGPGSQSALRRENVRRVTATLAGDGPATQAQLTRSTGLSAGTVASIVRDLEATGRVALSPTTSSGRRALMIHLVDTGRVAAGVDIGRAHVRAIVVSPTHEVLGEAVLPLPVGHDADTGIAAATEVLETALEKAGRARELVLGAGVGIPGPFDPSTGRIGSGAILPQWVGLDVAERMSTALELPVVVQNDANLGALAHLGWGEHRAGRDFVFVKIGTGIGMGLVLDGHLYSGHRGLAGEIGHTVVVDQGAVCRCGNRGCLETVASTAAMLRALAAVPHPPATVEALVDNANRGDIATRRVIEDAGLAVGKVLGQIASTLNPGTILIGGPLSPLGDLLLDPILRGLTRHTVADIIDTTTVEMAGLGDRAEALGAALGVLEATDPAELYGPGNTSHLEG
jgi:predicted NBD/HSP70 family sugar kinase